MRREAVVGGGVIMLGELAQGILKAIGWLVVVTIVVLLASYILSALY